MCYRWFLLFRQDILVEFSDIMDCDLIISALFRDFNLGDMVINYLTNIISLKFNQEKVFNPFASQVWLQSPWI